MNKNEITSNMNEMLAMCDEVKKICLPMFHFLTVRYFRLVRSYPDNTKFILCSNGFWLKKYFEEAYYNVEMANYNKFPNDSNGVVIHGTSGSQNPILKFWSKLGPYCEYNTILGVYKKNDSYLEFVNFGLSKDAFVSQNIFLNNQNLFMHFIQYFFNEATHLMEKAQGLKFNTTSSDEFNFKDNWIIGLPKEKQIKVFEKMPLEKVYIGDSLSDPGLTKMEVKIIFDLAKGFDKKEILKRNDISKEDLKQLISGIVEKLDIKTETDIKREVINKKLMPILRLLK